MQFVHLKYNSMVWVYQLCILWCVISQVYAIVVLIMFTVLFKMTPLFQELVYHAKQKLSLISPTTSFTIPQ